MIAKYENGRDQEFGDVDGANLAIVNQYNLKETFENQEQPVIEFIYNLYGCPVIKIKINSSTKCKCQIFLEFF